MYQQPYDPYGYQSYNGPQPDHYTSTVPGMPYPAPPPSHERYPAAEQPYPSGDHSYTTYQEQYYNSVNNYDPPPYGSQSYSSQPSHYPPNPTLSTSPPEQYPPAYPSLSHSSSNHYPPVAQTPSTVYPSVSNSANSTQDVLPASGSYSRPGTPYPTDSPFPSATESSWFGYGTKSDSAPPSAPPHLNPTYDSNRPNPYIKVPATSNVHGKYDEQHDRFGMPSAPVPSKPEVDRHDSGGHKMKQKLQEFANQALPKREDKKENVRWVLYPTCRCQDSCLQDCKFSLLPLCLLIKVMGTFECLFICREFPNVNVEIPFCYLCFIMLFFTDSCLYKQ